MPFGPGGGGSGGGAGSGAPFILDPPLSAVITINGLASNQARQGRYVDNSVLRRVAAKITAEFHTGAVAPTDGTVIEVWLLRCNDTSLATVLGDDNTIDADQAYPGGAGILPRNATLIGSISVRNLANTFFRGTFITPSVLGNFWGLAVANRTNQSLNAAGNVLTYETF